MLSTTYIMRWDSVQKDVRKKAHKANQQKCFDMMNELYEEFRRLAPAEKDDERAHVSQLLQKLRAEKAQEISNLQAAITPRENA
ncbi:hypothetical protein N7451_012252 [Penicillium sp. IBT 35674x]|nr:hypothetical protein N7451_012252 [Penicillium sp. IBT 35674x]